MEEIRQVTNTVGVGGRAVRLKNQVPFLAKICGLYFCILWCKLPAGVDNLSSSEAFQYVSERMKFEEGGGEEKLSERQIALLSLLLRKITLVRKILKEFQLSIHLEIPPKDIIIQMT